MIRAEAEAALAEYEAELAMGEPEENHQRLAAVVRAYLSPRQDAVLDAAEEAFWPTLNTLGARRAIVAALEAAEAAR